MKHKQSLRVISLCLILIGSALVEVSSSSIESSSSIQGGIKQGQTSQSAPADKEVAIVDDTGDLYTGVLDDYKGGTYSGVLLDGKPHGQGTWRHTNGEYVGEWKNDKMHGVGKQTWTCGN